MRIHTLLAGAALALGLSVGAPAQAHGSDARIWVSIGDVAFSAGRPYHRQHHYPLHKVRGKHGPRYYYTPVPGYAYYPPRPGFGHYPPPHPHAYPAQGYRGPAYYDYPPPPPPRPGYSRHRPGYYR